MSTSMSPSQTINFKDSKAATARPDFYTRVELDITAVLKGWQLSIFSYEWLHKDGNLKAHSELKDTDQAKQNTIFENLDKGLPLEIPVLGIGIQDNVEIGSGKAVLCSLAAKGLKTIPAHIPKSNESDFKAFLADVK